MSLIDLELRVSELKMRWNDDHKSFDDHLDLIQELNELVVLFRFLRELKSLSDCPLQFPFQLELELIWDFLVDRN